MRRLSLAAVFACAALIVPATAAAQTASKPKLQFPKLPFGETITQAPGISPPGANNWSCKPSEARPEPVVLVHGTFGDMTISWPTISPALRLNGYCVFALDLPKRATGPIWTSAAALATFIDKVLAATGAEKVDIVGHSQGGMMPRHYIKNGGADKVDDLVALTPSNHGTLLARLVDGLKVAQLCPACREQATGSKFLKELNARPEAPAPVDYTNIVTAFDPIVVPFTSGWLKEEPGADNVTNVALQNPCWRNRSDHTKVLVDPVALQWVLNALGRSGPANPKFRPLCGS
jgi:triacylglycerol esterase/lipase EstA (alpha/beta hydrolase family)